MKDFEIGTRVSLGTSREKRVVIVHLPCANSWEIFNICLICKAILPENLIKKRDFLNKFRKKMG